MKRNLTLAALALMTSAHAHAAWWVGLFADGTTTPSNAISIFDTRASGNTSPERTIGGETSDLRAISDLWLDAANQEMVVVDFRGNQVVRYDLDTSGDMAPFTSFSHPLMLQPRRLTPIPEHNEYAVLASSALIYVPADAVGGTDLNRWGNYHQSGLDNPFALTYLPGTDEVAVGDSEFVDNSNQGEIRFFARTDDGAMTTTRRIAGPNTRLGTFLLGLRHDPINHELIALVRDPAVNGINPGRIVVFSDSADGNAAPIREIAGDASQLLNVNSLAYDASTGEIAVGAGFQSVPLTVLIFNRTDQGNAAPKQRLSGPLTGLNAPNQVGGISSVPAPSLMFKDGFE